MSFTAAVLTISDKGARGGRADTSGPAIREMLARAGYEVVRHAVLPDERAQIAGALMDCAAEGVALVLTTGGTGFSPRDVTPEATRDVIEREAPGLAEAMRAESMKITPRGCLSRGVAGIRGRTLIVNLPGSERAARENLGAILPALEHGLQILLSEGSADCATPAPPVRKAAPSADAWLSEAKASQALARTGMFLIHNGVVREDARARVRDGDADARPVRGMLFSYDAEKVRGAVEATRALPGISFVRVWLNEGELAVGDDIMLVMVGGDIRPRVIDALERLVGRLKAECVTERELY
ncbi:MAG: molybdenum cofactor biosynthesis protein MoaE [Clostridia bacterium]|nr:molybdenum cofactor biosynthesis protein MoaE [Clostridia bacterium]